MDCIKNKAIRNAKKVNKINLILFNLCFFNARYTITITKIERINTPKNHKMFCLSMR